MAITLLLTVFYRQQDKDEVSFQNYAAIWSKHTAFTMLFVDHPEMQYFHNDLYGMAYLNKGHHYKRNIELERNFFIILIDALTTIIAYINVTKDDYSYAKMSIISRFDTLMRLHVKSKLFLEHWNKYKKFQATPDVVEYMKNNYNI